MRQTEEHKRLAEYRARTSNWKNWGPYLAERAWGTVREDYSIDGEAWDYFTFEDSHSRTYRWNEDGLMGICERYQNLCFSVALWNGIDPYLKERLFGLTGNQGNHGEDVKEVYYYLESTPTHSYMKMLYRYPQAAFPYRKLIQENAKLGYLDPEYELVDTGVLDKDYFDVVVTYAKAEQNDICIEINVDNNSDEAASIHVLPQIWFRNTWSWGYRDGPMGHVTEKPQLKNAGTKKMPFVEAHHMQAGTYYLFAEDAADMLFTENESNNELLFQSKNESPYVKDAFHRYVVQGETGAINPEETGTKTAIHYQTNVPANSSKTFRLRLSTIKHKRPFVDFDDVLKTRLDEANEFYQDIQAKNLSEDERNVQRQAFAGMLMSKQLYYYDVEQWLNGDPASPAPPARRKKGRNSDWQHMHNFDIVSMPDKWEYPWYAVWDSAFHCIPLALVDADFAKRQLELFTREWYMHPNGQLPAYEWNFGDVNPPVHAWAALRVYQIDQKENGTCDRRWLEGLFHKLLLNFTWWVNRKDHEDNNIFQGGFLGLDNITVFDRSKPLPTGGTLDQADGTAWMGFYSLSMLKIALELAKEDPVYQDIATKFFEHFLTIAAAINNLDGNGNGLWSDEDGIYYDMLRTPEGKTIPLKVRSLVGLMPLIAVYTLEPEVMQQFPSFARRVDWFLHNRSELAGEMADLHQHGQEERLLMSFLTKERLESVLNYLLDETEFLAPNGIRSLSKYHEQNPFQFYANGDEAFTVNYEPAESETWLFGGNSNWRGPIWFPINYLIIEALQRYDHFYGQDLKVEYPTASGNKVCLWDISVELSRRLTRLFLKDENGKRPSFGNHKNYQDPKWQNHILFYEYFHAETGKGLGASHQTGWTGLVAKLIQQSGGS